MAKFVSVFFFTTFIAYSSAIPVDKRDVSELLRHHEPDHVVYGNGILGHQAEIEHEHFNIDKVGNYDFG